MPPSRASRSRRAAASSDAPKRQTIASRLARLGLRSDWDFLLHLPLRYEDETRITPIAALQPGAEAQVEGTVCRSEIVRRGGRQLAVRLQDASGELLLRFLHFYPSQVKLLATGRRVRVFGAARGGLAGMEMVHPRVKAADADVPLAVRLTPVYPGTEGVPQRWLRKRIERALRDVELTDTLPAALIERCRLLPLAAALGTLHQPPIDADPAALSERSGPQWERIKFDEALAQQISLRLARAERQSQRAPALAAGTLAARLLAALPFELTAAQRRACDEIHADLERHTPMHRLVQGDVGSGKTVVAALAAACTIDSGYQAALMAPTEILAEQHFRRIEHWLAPLGVRVAWLAGKLAAADKRAAQVAVADGSAQLVIGTHALIQKAVDFARLGLAIVDEQHRFGVAQRLRLRQGARDGRTRPHLLMLSATPIPRTLAMSYLADLDVSVIDELPPGRRPVITKLVGSGRRNEVLARVRGEIAQGRQAYWVCPLVDESGDPAPDAGDAGLTSPSGRGTARRPRPSAQHELTAATRMYEQTRTLLPDLRLGLLHGQMPPAQKAQTMQRFAAGQIDVLVATTVVEVGVDVPNASLMVIEHAQRFGLAQLHQLRGRVGRGAAQSYCVLLYDDPLSEAARERLRVIYQTHDGFEVARRDLQLRGPGEFLGARQAGVALLRFADPERDARLIERARDCAAHMLAEHPQASEAHVRRWLGVRTAMLAA